MNFAVIPWGKEYLENKLFSEQLGGINREGRLMPFHNMKKVFEQRGDRIETVDIYCDLHEVNYFLFFDYDTEWILRLVELGLADRMIYCNAEPTVVNPHNSKEGYRELRKIFPYILTWNDDLVDNISVFKRVIPYYTTFKRGNEKYENRKLLTNISGNKYSRHPLELYSERERVISFFEKEHIEDFDLYGTGWDKEKHPSYIGSPRSKEEVYHKYRFALCLENMWNVNGYVTEKVFDCFFCGIVPIYKGALDIDRYIGKNSYISYDQFESLDELYKYLSEMTEEKYNMYIEAGERVTQNTELFSKMSGEMYALNIYNAIGHTKEFRLDRNKIKQLRLVQKKHQVVNKLFSLMRKDEE